MSSWEMRVQNFVQKQTNKQNGKYETINQTQNRHTHKILDTRCIIYFAQAFTELDFSRSRGT